VVAVPVVWAGDGVRLAALGNRGKHRPSGGGFSGHTGAVAGSIAPVKRRRQQDEPERLGMRIENRGFDPSMN
jgi:hypothetical protein